MIRALSVELDGFQFFPALLFFSEELILYANIYHFRSFSSPFSFEYRPRRENSAGYIGIGGFIFFVWIGLDDFKKVALIESRGCRFSRWHLWNFSAPSLQTQGSSESARRDPTNKQRPADGRTQHISKTPGVVFTAQLRNPLRWRR